MSQLSGSRLRNNRFRCGCRQRLFVSCPVWVMLLISDAPPSLCLHMHRFHFGKLITHLRQRRRTQGNILGKDLCVSKSHAEKWRLKAPSGCLIVTGMFRETVRLGQKAQQNPILCQCMASFVG